MSQDRQLCRERALGWGAGHAAGRVGRRRRGAGRAGGRVLARDRALCAQVGSAGARQRSGRAGGRALGG